MASDSLRSMYKVKLREENTTSSRRTSRGLERKKHREDEVNKRRLLSSDMSPVLEDNMDGSHHRSQDKHSKLVTHEKVSTRLERLKQWREEKQRKTQQQKKGSQKPVFRVSPLKHIEESNLYRRSAAQEVSATVVSSSRQQVKAQPKAVKSAGSSAVTADRKSPKHQPAKAASTRPRKAAAVQQDRVTGSTQAQPAPVSQQGTRSQAASKQHQRGKTADLASKLHQRGKTADLASKLTVSAAAKAKSNTDQPKAFLRANSRVTRASAHNQAVELHLSDSAVSTPKHSTPAARRSVRGNKAPASTRKQTVENLLKTAGRVTDKSADVSAMGVAEEASDKQLHGPLLSQDAVHGQRWRLSAEINHKKGSKGHIEDVDITMGSTETQVVSVLEMSNKENVACPQSQSQCLTPSRNRETYADVSVSRRKSPGGSQHLASTISVQVISTAQQSKRSVTGSRPQGEVDAGLALEVRGDASTQLPDDGTALPQSHKKQFNSAVAKRRSVRIASLAFCSPAHSHPEDELVTTKYRKTPAVKRRPSAAAPLTENSDKSTFVSVSNEEACHLMGENIVSKTDTSATATSPLKKYPKVTADDPSAVYEVRKPGQSEASVRALQELAVRKREGEASFIEVALDDSTDADASVSTKSVPALAEASGDKDISSVTAAAKEDNQSTQPFTPRSHEMTTLEDGRRTSETPSLTPRSSRSRGLSMSGLSSFKTPGQPVSTTRSRVGSRRRETVTSTALKSPEEMIEILKNSPMIELTRRRSRHVRLSSGNHLIPVVENTPIDQGIISQHGVQNFRQLLLTERAKLQQLCEAWTQVSTGSLDLAED
ncbi:unnamed protein product, partial [Candidula unifasciata]